MSGATDRLPRLLALVPYLRTHPDELITDVAAVFDVSEKQLREDLELLFVTGLPGGSPGDLIDLSFEGDRVSLIDPQTLDRPLRLTADEATGLLVAARALADVPGLQERDALDRAIAKLAEASPATVAIDVALEPEDEALATLRVALDGRRRLHLRYMVEARDEVTERDVDPMRLLLRDGRWYLEGWCRRAEAVRLFRLDRVVEATLLDLPAEPPPQAAPRDLEDGLFRPDPDDLRIVLELDSAGALGRRPLSGGGHRGARGRPTAHDIAHTRPRLAGTALASARSVSPRSRARFCGRTGQSHRARSADHLFGLVISCYAAAAEPVPKAEVSRQIGNVRHLLLSSGSIA